MGRKERRERELKRESYATKHSAEKRKQTLIAIGVFAVIGVIVGYAAFTFSVTGGGNIGGPANAGAIGSEHSHAAIIMSVFGDVFDFSNPAYQIKSNWIHFEGGDGSTIHKHATGVTLGYLFDSLPVDIDDKCVAFQDREFCTNDEYKLVYYINGNVTADIRDYEIIEDDRILISYGAGEDLRNERNAIANQTIIYR